MTRNSCREITAGICNKSLIGSETTIAFNSFMKTFVSILVSCIGDERLYWPRVRMSEHPPDSTAHRAVCTQIRGPNVAIDAHFSPCQSHEAIVPTRERVAKLPRGPRDPNPRTPSNEKRQASNGNGRRVRGYLESTWDFVKGSSGNGWRERRVRRTSLARCNHDPR
jgi:hypothetical protein